MSDEEKVLAKFPRAEARYKQPTRQLGSATPIDAGGWIVFSSDTLGAADLGRGNSEADAWADAATKLSSP